MFSRRVHRLMWINFLYYSLDIRFYLSSFVNSTSHFSNFADFRQLQTPNAQTKYYEILPGHTKIAPDTTRIIANRYFELKYHFLTLQKKIRLLLNKCVHTWLVYQAVLWCGVILSPLIHLTNNHIYHTVPPQFISNLSHDYHCSELSLTEAVDVWNHYDGVIMGAIASPITSLTIVYSTVYSGADQRKHQSSASLVFVWGTHRGPVNSQHKWPVNSQHKGPVTRKMFPFDDVIILWRYDWSYILHFDGIVVTSIPDFVQIRTSDAFSDGNFFKMTAFSF